MLKKIFTSALLLTLVWLGGCADESESLFQARSVAVASSQPAGAYEMTGPMKINLKVPKIITMNASSPDMGVLGELVGLSALFSGTSGEPGNFAMQMDLLGMPLAITGTWTATSAKKFKVVADLAPLIAQIEAMGGTVTVTKNTFTGTVAANGQLKGTFGLGVKLGLQEISMSLAINAPNYVAKPVVAVGSASSAYSLLQPTEPFVLNGYFGTLFERVVNAARTTR